MSVRPEVIPFVLGALIAGTAVFLGCRLRHLGYNVSVLSGAIPALILAGYFLYFFRDPERTPPADPEAVVAGADGRVAKITRLGEADFPRLAAFAGLDGDRTAAFLDPDVVRVSIFLSLFDVHVNRAPIAGRSSFLGYFPGRHFFTFGEKSSEHNQHNSILIENDRTLCLINQIVGPVCRRVVYWPPHDRAVELEKGDRIGMMKFGSRLDLYFRGRDVELVVTEGDRVRAGETVIARLR